MADSGTVLGTEMDQLCELAQSRAGRDQLVGVALQSALQTVGGSGVALYLRWDGELKRQSVAGSSALFPVVLDAEGLDHLPHRKLAGGALVFASDSVLPESREWSDLVLSLLSHALRLGSRVKEQRFAVNYRGVELEALYDVGLAIASTLDLEDLNEEVLLRAVSLLDARRGALFLLADGRYVLQGTIGGDACATVAKDAEEIATAIDGRPSDGSDSLLPGAQYLLAVPIEVDGRPRGLLVVGDKESRTGVGPFEESDRRTLLLFANQAGIALENAQLHRQALEKERLEKELDLAAEIQRRLLPKTVPDIPGFELAGWSRPARHVGGDYYSFLSRSGGRIGLVLGDVSGKGMPAALLVSTLHSAIKILSNQQEIGPELMDALNSHLCDATASNQFVTLLLAELEPDTGRLRYLNGGHNPAVMLRQGSEVELFVPDGLPAGMMAVSNYGIKETVLNRGDLLCIYSDGITEAESPDDREYELDGLIEILQEHREAPLCEIVDAIDRSVAEFTHRGPQGDDQTVVLLRRQ